MTSTNKTTQGRRLISHLKRRQHTYMEMLEYRESVSPWKRVLEALRPGERLIKGSKRVGSQDLTTWRVVRG